MPKVENSGAGEPKGSSSPLNGGGVRAAAFISFWREYGRVPRRNKVNRRHSVDEKVGDPYISRFTLREASLDTKTGRVKLTDLATCGGCAAKYSAARLEQLLAGFVPVEAENLLVGLAPADDAAVYRLDDERALIFTLDFFPPVVDDPGDYGAIAATNALNDVFAMGGTPLLALSIAAFPEELPMEMLAEVF
ncbi:MAG: selenide, water dikinase, partial [Gaiellaceae bacterium]|nr:selenide, water dikinase [Gaiellaceae bacterium]